MEYIDGLRSRKGILKPIITKKPEGGAEESAPPPYEEPLSPASLMFHEPDFNVYVIAIMGSRTPIYPEILYPNLRHTLLKHPRFTSLQVKDEKDGGTMKWIQTEVDLHKHIIIPEIDPNVDPDKFVEDYASNLSKTHIDPSQPLWDLHLLNAKTSKAESIGIFRIHHSIGDGTSLMSLLLACTRQLSDPTAPPTVPVKKKKPSLSVGIFRRLWLLVVMTWNTFVDIMMFMATAYFLKDTETPIKGRAGVEFTPRRFVYRTVSLDDMKMIKNAIGGTINDVALGVTQAGLSRYLNRKYGEGKKDNGATEKKNNLPKNIRLRSTILINLRPSSGIQALADMMEKNAEAKWGNWIGYVLLSFKIALRDNPLDYVHEAKATIDRKKRSLEALYTFSISEIFLKLFGIKASGALGHRVLSHTTMCFSNLVGPIEEIGFYGHEMEFLAPSSYGQPHGLMINFQSYVNQMTIVLSVDDETVPDPQTMLDEFEESLKLIKNAVLEKGLAPRG